MTIHKAIAIGLTANEVSKKITGSDESSAARTAVATGTGALMGMAAAGTITVGAAALGVSTAPVTVPLALFSAGVAGIASLFD